MDSCAVCTGSHENESTVSSAGPPTHLQQIGRTCARVAGHPVGHRTRLGGAVSRAQRTHLGGAAFLAYKRVQAGPADGVGRAARPQHLRAARQGKLSTPPTRESRLRVTATDTAAPGHATHLPRELACRECGLAQRLHVCLVVFCELRERRGDGADLANAHVNACIFGLGRRDRHFSGVYGEVSGKRTRGRRNDSVAVPVLSVSLCLSVSLSLSFSLSLCPLYLCPVCPLCLSLPLSLSVSLAHLVVNVARGVPDVVPEEARDERRPANLVQNVVVDEP